ncbi:Nif3-like dinuclear metal center hexameric protein [Virgibacillus siamensis]|uniref:Nif3-like dinuclear metal center hexameric protein n=1 Tax=Virgibacillus siamensis TaxID=480071 RepID=UPI000986D30A|nr:Nif3-like dinuclear metal center hexameric protein [Virgibacillus siamensis]
MTQVIRSKDLFAAMESLAPAYLAYNWDNVGLQVGTYNKNVQKVMVTLDVLESVVDEAVEKNIDVIIAHHPLLFKSVHQLNTDDTKGRILQKLIQHDISVFASHTNLDIAEGGVNDIMCDELGITNRKILLPSHTEKLVKIVVFVPGTHAEDVRNAMSDSGAGHIGNYSHCTFQTSGQGTFMPLEGTNPYLGTTNELEYADEMRIETIVPQPKLPSVINAVLKAHPYEEPAYDLYPMENEGRTLGIGRIGSLKEETTLKSFSEHMKKVLNINKLRVTGDLSQTVKTVAILGGSGEKYWSDAWKLGADVYITGDMTFHAAQDAWQAGMSVIDPGHYAEKVMKKPIKDFLESKFPDLEFVVSASNTDPFQFI